MAHTVRSLAEMVGGVVLGDGAETVITGVSDLKSAGPGDISFLGNAKYEGQARASRAGAILAEPADAAKLPGTRIQVESPSTAFTRITALFAPPAVAVRAGDSRHGGDRARRRSGRGRHDPSPRRHRLRCAHRCGHGYRREQLHRRALHDWRELSSLSLGHAARAQRCSARASFIHSGAVIGSDGFGYTFEGGRYVKIEHTGHVQIDDDVEIGANTTIDRARFGRTHIGEGAKIDNLVMIAHNVVVGAHSIIVGQVGISGSTTLGRYVTLAGQVGLAGHLTVGDKAVLTAQSGVTKDVPPGAVMTGSHARPAREFLKLEALTSRLPDMFARLKALEKKVGLDGEA